jgi:hypothetical protein
VDLFDSVTATARSGGTNRISIANLAYLFNQVGTWV